MNMQNNCLSCTLVHLTKLENKFLIMNVSLLESKDSIEIILGDFFLWRNAFFIVVHEVVWILEAKNERFVELSLQVRVIAFCLLIETVRKKIQYEY